MYTYQEVPSSYSAKFEAVCIGAWVKGRVWALLSAILWLGNIEFVEGANDSVSVAPGFALCHAAALLRVPEAGLASVLCSRLITAGLGPGSCYTPSPFLLHTPVLLRIWNHV